jgi:hypothetical protein
MQFICFNLLGPVRWRIHRNDPGILPVECFPGWLAVNPLIYPSVSPSARLPSDAHVMVALHDGDALVRSSLLVLARAADATAPVPDFEQALNLLGRCRHVSRQALLSDSMLAVEGRAGPFEVHPIPEVVFPRAEGGLPARVTRRAVDGALTVAHLRTAAGLDKDFVMPIHDSMSSVRERSNQV